jgi:hemoglobin
MNMKKTMFKTVLAFVMIGSLSGIAACNDDDEKKDDSLYARLGKTEAISAVVDQFLANVAADNTINARFAATVASQTRLQALRTNLINQICQGTGGPCTYTGKTMMEAHAGMNISAAEFNALVGDLVSALDNLKVPEKEKNELLAILGPMQNDIVGK